MKQILVTGGAGFIGSHLTPQLLAAGWKVTVLDDLSSGNRAYVPMEADFIEQDVRDPGALAQVFASNDFEAVVHFAAQTMVPVSLAKPVYDCELNVVATVELLEQCRVHGVRKVVFASSAAVYGRPCCRKTACMTSCSTVSCSLRRVCPGCTLMRCTAGSQ